MRLLDMRDIFELVQMLFMGKVLLEPWGWGTASGVFEVVETGLRFEGNADDNSTEAIIGVNYSRL